MTADEFVVHDMGNFPVVWSRNGAVVSGSKFPFSAIPNEDVD